MSVRGAVVLAGSGAQFGDQSIQNFVGVGSSIPVCWQQGGRTAFVLDAAAIGTLSLQVQGPGGRWMPVASSFPNNQVFVFDAMAGNYALSNSASSSIGVWASLVAVPYNK